MEVRGRVQRAKRRVRVRIDWDREQDILAEEMWEARSQIEEYLASSGGLRVKVIEILRHLNHLDKNAFWRAIRTMHGDGWRVDEKLITTIEKAEKRTVNATDWVGNVV